MDRPLRDAGSLGELTLAQPLIEQGVDQGRLVMLQLPHGVPKPLEHILVGQFFFQGRIIRGKLDVFIFTQPFKGILPAGPEYDAASFFAVDGTLRLEVYLYVFHLTVALLQHGEYLGPALDPRVEFRVVWVVLIMLRHTAFLHSSEI